MKKTKMGYKEEGTVKEVDVAKNIKTIKIKMPNGKIKIIKIPNPFKRKERLGTARYRMAKKGGKV